MKENNGAQTLIKTLEDLDVEHIFGYTGGAILPVFTALQDSKINVVINTNEQASAFSAAGYSRSTDKVGVAIVTSGPAITNTLTAVADAYGDSIPLLVFAGQVPEHKIGTDSFQHINVASVFADATKKVITLKNGQDIESTIKDAYHYARSGKPGPVVIDFPMDKQQRTESYNALSTQDFADTYNDERHLSDKQCEQFFTLLTQAQKPLLYVGGGLNSQRGSKALRAFKAYFNLPSVNTLMAKGVADEQDQLHLGMLGMFGVPAANKIIQENDFFFALGVRWDDRVAEKVGFAIEAKIAYIDINPEKMQQIKSERSPEFTFIGDAPTALEDLVAYAQRRDVQLEIDSWRAQAKELAQRWPLNYNRVSSHIQAAGAMELLAHYVDENTKITTGVGNHQMLAAQYLRMRTPKSFMSSGSYGTMGFGLPTAIGVQYAHPQDRVIAIDGDGSLCMNLGELYTVATQNLPVKILLLNNQSDGMVVNLQDAAYNGARVGTQRNKDVSFAHVAGTMGFDYARRVSKKEELQEAMEAFLAATGPSMLEVKTDPEEVLYPKVVPGTSYKDMQLGPYIKERK